MVSASVGIRVRIPEEREGISNRVILEKLNIDSLQQSDDTLMPITVDMANTC